MGELPAWPLYSLSLQLYTRVSQALSKALLPLCFTAEYFLAWGVEGIMSFFFGHATRLVRS